MGRCGNIGRKNAKAPKRLVRPMFSSPAQNAPFSGSRSTVPPNGRQIAAEAKRTTSHIKLSVNSSRHELKQTINSHEQQLNDWEAPVSNLIAPVPDCMSYALPKSDAQSPVASPITPGVDSANNSAQYHEDDEMEGVAHSQSGVQKLNELLGYTSL